VARIDVMTDRPVGVVDPRLFGGVLDDTSPRSGPGGSRADMHAAVRDLGVTSVRWAGGDDPDQFVAWCSAVGAEPVLRLDLGTDTLDEALAWVEYCHGVRHWALGQDISDQADPERYVARARRWAKALRLGTSLQTPTGSPTSGCSSCWTWPPPATRPAAG
jgi:hypothetical protein